MILDDFLCKTLITDVIALEKVKILFGKKHGESVQLVQIKR